MKNKIVALVLCGMLAGCLRAGDYDLLPVRKKIVDGMVGYSVEFAGEDEKFVESKKEQEKDYVLNKAVTVEKGDSILSNKEYVRNFYSTVVYKPNKKGALQNQAFPMKLDNQKEYKILGWVTIDGVKYSILESDLDDYVFLFDKDGNFYKNAGVMDDGVLKLVDEEIFTYPSDLKMQNVVKTRDEISNVKTGYEVRYSGKELDRIWFDYITYDDDNPNSGHFERISFPDKPGLITINGNGLRILKADKDRLTYMILKSEE